MSKADKKKLAIIVPFLNEEENLPVVYERVAKVMEDQPEDWELIFIDDGSTDGSAKWVADTAKTDPRAKMIRLSRNFGHQIAITAGLDSTDADAAIIMDADLQDPPEVIADLLAKWREGNDVVYAVREEREGESWLKKFLASSFYRIFHIMAKVDVPMNAGDFRLIDRKVIDALGEVRELHRFMRGLTCWVGFSQCAVSYKREARHAGYTKYPVWKSLNLAWDGLTSFSGTPLRWMTAFGMGIGAAGGLLLIWVIVRKLISPIGYEPGWATIIAFMLFLGGIQLLSLGLIGQYVSRIFEETKKRPLYYVKERIGMNPSD